MNGERGPPGMLCSVCRSAGPLASAAAGFVPAAVCAGWRLSVGAGGLLSEATCQCAAGAALLQEEAAKAGKAREQTVARLQQLEKQKANVEVVRDELKVRDAVLAACLWWREGGTERKAQEGGRGGVRGVKGGGGAG